jgi:hypothetical protein
VATSPPGQKRPGSQRLQDTLSLPTKTELHVQSSAVSMPGVTTVELCAWQGTQAVSPSSGWNWSAAQGWHFVVCARTRSTIESTNSAIEAQVEQLELAGRAEAAVLVERALRARDALALFRARERRGGRCVAQRSAGRALGHDTADREVVEGAVLDPVCTGAARAGLAARAAEARGLVGADRRLGLQDLQPIEEKKTHSFLFITAVPIILFVFCFCVRKFWIKLWKRKKRFPIRTPTGCIDGG